MKAFQSLIERSLYYLLLITLIVNVTLGVLLYANITQVNRNTTALEANQKSNTMVVLDYFACLLRIQPQNQNLKQQEDACYSGGVK